MTDVSYTQEEGALIDSLIGWALDQDHDASSMGDQEYLTFLVDDDVVTEEKIDRVRELLHSAYGKAGRGVTQEDIDEVALDDNEHHSVAITPEARAAVEALLDREVYVVISCDPDTRPAEWDVEVLDQCPRWNWFVLGQIVRVANVNGGDSALVQPRPGTADRADVTRRLANAFDYRIADEDYGTEAALQSVFSYISGIVAEYANDGDQMVESTCICYAGPGGHKVINPDCPNERPGRA